MTTRRRRRAAATGGSAVLLALAFATPAFAAFPGLNGRIAFVSERVGAFDALWTVDPTNPSDVTQLTSTGDDTDPSVSPNGSTVAFSRLTNTAGIYTVPLGTPESVANPVHLVVDDPNATETEPSWYPDGHTLVYVSNAGGTDNLYKIDTAVPGATPVKLFSDTANDDQPVVDPADPTKIVYVRNTNGVPQLWEYDTSTPTPTQIDLSNSEPSNDVKPDFSPLGGWIVFQSTRPVGTSNASQIWIMKADGTGAHPLFSTTNGTGSNDTSPVFSPDGHSIAFVRPVPGESLEVETTVGGSTMTGGAVTDITNVKPTDDQPRWAPIPQAATNLPEVGTPAVLAIAGVASFGAVALFRRRRSA